MRVSGFFGFIARVLSKGETVLICNIFDLCTAFWKGVADSSFRNLE